MFKKNGKRLKTEIPQKYTKTFIPNIYKYEAKPMHDFMPIIWDKAEGAYVWDIFGNKFIDFTSTIFVANTGHSQVVKDVIIQAKKLVHSYTFPTLVRDEFLKELHKFLPSFCQKTFLASAGSEVTSWAVKLMRYYSKSKLIVHVDGAFHGKTGNAGKLENEEVKIPFDTVETENVIRSLNSIKKDIAGVMIESYQGWSAKFMDRKYIKELVSWAKKNDIPVCFDEIQGGFYRTGTKFAYEHYGVTPDLICMGKALGGGLPISALSGRKKYFNVKGLSSTHSSNPLCCSASLSVLKYFNKKFDIKRFYDKIRCFEHLIFELSETHKKYILECNIKGFVASLIFKNRKIADKVCNNCLKRGLLVVRTNREAIKIGPPLIISRDSLIEGISIISQAIGEL